MYDVPSEGLHRGVLPLFCRCRDILDFGVSEVESGEGLVNIYFLDQVEKTEARVSWVPSTGPCRMQVADSVQIPQVLVCRALSIIALGFQMLNFFRGQKCMDSSLP